MYCLVSSVNDFLSLVHIQGEKHMVNDCHEQIYLYFTYIKLGNLECARGFTMNSTNNECTPCPRGAYSDMENADSCTSCPEGVTTSQEGSEQRSQCTGGTFIFNVTLNETLIDW